MHATSDVITRDCLPTDVTRSAPGSEVHAAPAGWNLVKRAQQLLSDGQGDVYRRLQAEFDEQLLRLAMEHTGGNQAHAAELLGLSRMTLRTKLRSVPTARAKDPHETHDS
jgi:two-component system nitrogen regulation response regulator GlnG